MAKKVLIWGCGVDYERLLSHILFEVQKGNITVEGIVARSTDIFSNKKDGFKLLIKEEIKDVDFDYIIVTSVRCFSEIKQEAISLGVPEQKIINGQIMIKLPLFDFKRYTSLIENPVTILSDDCVGGFIYNYLELPFSSPLVNVMWTPANYFKFLEDPIFYLKSELKMIRFGNLYKERVPIGLLGDANKNVKVSFVHTYNFNQVLDEWNRRVARINYNNIFVKSYIPSRICNKNLDKYISIYEKLPYKKILFYIGKRNFDNCYKSQRFIWNEVSNNKPISRYSYNGYCLLNYHHDLDVLKLLNGEEPMRFE